MNLQSEFVKLQSEFVNLQLEFVNLQSKFVNLQSDFVKLSNSCLRLATFTRWLWITESKTCWQIIFRLSSSVICPGWSFKSWHSHSASSSGVFQSIFENSHRLEEECIKDLFSIALLWCYDFPQVPQHCSFGRDLEEHLQDQADRLNISNGAKTVKGEGHQFPMIQATSWPEMQCQTTKVEELKASWRNQLFGQPRK